MPDGHERMPPLRRSFAGAVMGALTTAGFGGLCWAQYANLRGILGHLRPEALAGWGTSGDAVSFGMVAGEGVIGVVLGCALGVEDHMEPVNAMPAGRRKVYAAGLAVALLGFAVGEGGLSWIGEDQGEEARMEAAQERARQDAAAAQGGPTTAVAAVAGGVGAHPTTMARAVEAAGNADVKRMKEAAEERRQEARDAREAAAHANEAHRLKNTAVLVWVALMLAAAVGLCAVVVGAFVHSLLAIPAGIVAAIGAGITWWAGLRRRTSEVSAAAPAAPPSGDGGLPVQVRAAAPEASKGFLDRLARWPVVRMFRRMRPAVAGGAA
jgi:hypothetical protein